MSILQRHRKNRTLVWVTGALCTVFIIVLIVTIVLGIQSHNDRVLGVQIAETESGLRTQGAQIAAIRPPVRNDERIHCRVCAR